MRGYEGDVWKCGVDTFIIKVTTLFEVGLLIQVSVVAEKEDKSRIDTFLGGLRPSLFEQESQRVRK